MSAFIITARAETAFSVFSEEHARYAAEMDDGRGFVAISDVDSARAFGLVQHGQVYMESPTDPADPRWEELIKLPRGPKRKVAQGDEKFALLAPTASAIDVMRDIMEWEALRGASIVTHDLVPQVLVECGVLDDVPMLTTWEASAVRYIDVRTAVPA